MFNCLREQLSICQEIFAELLQTGVIDNVALLGIFCSKRLTRQLHFILIPNLNPTPNLTLNPARARVRVGLGVGVRVRVSREDR